MAQPLNRGMQMRLMLLFAAAAACSGAVLSGTSALFNHVAERAAEIPAARLA